MEYLETWILMGYVEKLIQNWPLSGSSLDLLVSAERQLKDARSSAFVDSRAWACQALLEFCALKQFGFDTTDEPLQQLAKEAIQLGIDFYYGDWATEENIIKWCKSQGWEATDQRTTIEISRCSTVSDPKTLKPWRDALSALILLCTMFQETESRAKICDWFGASPKPEYSGLYFETEATTIVLASFLRTKPMDGIEKLVAEIAKCKRPYALARLKLIHACFDGDQHVFGALLPECLDLFYKSHKKKEPCIMTDLIAVDESTVVLLARDKGLVIPPLSEKQTWALMSAESIGLGGN
jgi:hypothetical protein